MQPTSQKFSQWHVFWQLLCTDFIILKRIVHDHIINLTIWMSTVLVVSSYLMGAFGVTAAFSTFMLGGLAASAGLFGIFPNVAMMISDFEGDQIITYELTLPIPSWMVFLRLIVYYTLNFSILGLLVLPLGKLLIWEQFSLSHVAWGRYCIIFLLTHIFYASYTLWIVSRVKNMTKIGNVWMRMVYPLWFMGGFQFSWQMIATKWPALAYVNLLNPLTYIMEGTRAAVLGQEGYLNFWLCATALIFFSIISASHGIMLLKKRLDFV
jgi:ABC-2 type transport system permease protein